MKILFWNFDPLIKSVIESYNILFAFLKGCGRAPNGIGHFMILLLLLLLLLFLIV